MNAVKSLKLPVATHSLGVLNRAVELFTRLPRNKALEQMKRSTIADLDVVTVSSISPPFEAHHSQRADLSAYDCPSSLRKRSTSSPSASRSAADWTPTRPAKPTAAPPPTTCATTASGAKSTSRSCSRASPRARPVEAVLRPWSLRRCRPRRVGPRSRRIRSTTLPSTRAPSSCAMPVGRERASGGGRSRGRSGAESGARPMGRRISSTPGCQGRSRQGSQPSATRERRRHCRAQTRPSVQK